MIDTVRAFAVKWLLEPTAKTPEPQKKGIRFVVTLVPAEYFAEYAPIKDFYVRYATNSQGLISYYKLTLRNVFAVMIYDGEEFKGAYSRAYITDVYYETDGVMEYKGKCYQPYDNGYDFIQEQYYKSGKSTYYHRVYDDDGPITAIEPPRSAIANIGVTQRIRFQNTKMKYYQLIDENGNVVENSGYMTDTSNPSYNPVLSLNGGNDYVFTNGLTNSDRSYYIGLFNQNEKVVEYDFNF